MRRCLFVSDLHGRVDRYEKLFRVIDVEQPRAVFVGGDFLPSWGGAFPTDARSEGFLGGYVVPRLVELQRRMSAAYPRVFIIMGNDDERWAEPSILENEASGVWEYVHNRKYVMDDVSIYGYAYIPPTPFLLKDWERYDVSRYVDPGAVSPEEGHRTVPVSPESERYETIREDLNRLAGGDDLQRAVFLFHAPPYQTVLDLAALHGKMIDHVPLDPHVGSVAVRRFIETRQPLLTLHGHVHDSARLTGHWRDRIGRTHMFSACHDGPELALVRFDLNDLEAATRELL